MISHYYTNDPIIETQVLKLIRDEYCIKENNLYFILSSDCADAINDGYAFYSL